MTFNATSTIDFLNLNSTENSEYLELGELNPLSSARESSDVDIVPSSSVVSSETGFILSYSSTKVEVELVSGIKVLFPKVVFLNPEEIHTGGHISYEIKRDSEGYRFQELKVIQPDVDRDFVDEIDNILDFV